MLTPWSSPVPWSNAISRFTGRTEADRFYLDEAFRERSKSDDPKARHVAQSGVGVVLVGEEGEITRSANVLPPRLREAYSRSEKTVEADDRYHVIEHAERAAIFKAFLAGHNLNGSTIYCTRFPCSDCARAIVWSGITRAVFPSGFAGEARWIDAQRAALKIMREAGITVRYLPPVFDPSPTD
ncbi:deaminase [Novosphingobium huizhouense]|uniref:deaminase n=1 Tax=Novosphingobium huizhouense TaxID=2866625 RepID=UPI001CD85A9C